VAPLVPFVVAAALFTSACGQGPGIGACSAQPDVTGRWVLQLTPPDLDGGVTVDDAAVIPRADTLTADLMQVRRTGVLTLGSLLWGTLRSADQGFFDVLAIPQLRANNGSKTGAILGCQLKINVPVALPVTDDNTDQGPLKLQLSGAIAGPGVMAGGPSLVRMSDDPLMSARAFTWTGTLAR
jgi:hypothetical protein